ncbi:MAG: SH3 domain-containing protein [Clostridia bacterium]|nr:SH3 domain-containing protein [Clostridia bacterium]
MKRTGSMGALMLFVLLLCLPASADSWGSAAAVYAPVLSAYEAALTGDEHALLQRESASDAYRCAIYAGMDPYDAVGFAYFDLNLDGVPELVIGTTDDTGDQLIFEILTLTPGGDPVTLIRGWERFRVQLAISGERYGYYAEGSSGASNAIYERGTAGADTAWADAHTLEFLRDENGAVLWTLDGAQVSEQQAQDLLDTWQRQTVRISLPSFSDHENARIFGDRDDGGDGYRFTASPKPDGPNLRITVRDTGRENPPDALRERVLAVTVEGPQGDVLQSFEYSGSETPSSESLAAPAWLQDLNLDGCLDLVLVTGRGASNEFSVFCLWDDELGRFGPILAERPFDPGAETYLDTIVPLELVNFGVKKGSDGLVRIESRESDGAASHTDRIYVWDSQQSLSPRLVYDVHTYDTVREQLFALTPQVSKVWDHKYASSWFYGDTRPYADHEAAVLSYDEEDPVYMHVANTDWVHLREMDTKQSESLGRLNRGTEVRVLRENCADGWTLVLTDLHTIGYIWHSFLE